MNRIYFHYILLLLVGCRQNSNSPEDYKPDTSVDYSRHAGSGIDYKISGYKFFIGEHKDSIGKSIDLRHDYLADDGIINENGLTHYMNIGEDLIKVGKYDEVLPALFFTTNKNKLIKFSASVVFTPDANAVAPFSNFLKAVEPNFGALKISGNRIDLAKNMVLCINNKNYDEQFNIDTTGRKYNAVFIYKKSLKENPTEQIVR